MKKFLSKLCFFCILFVFLCIGFVFFHRYVIDSQYELNYQASLIDKVNRLKKINEPKIVLVGNSNLAFGICSEKIESALEMPVVNLGLHAGLGNAFHEEIAKININPGDIIVVCHSDFSDDDSINDTKLAWITYDWNKDLWQIIRRKDYLSMLKSYPSYLRDSLLLWSIRRGNGDSNSQYSRTAFNEYGDVIRKPVESQIKWDEFFRTCNISVPSLNDTCINRLNDFNRYCLNQGAKLVVAGYPIAYGEYSEFDEKDFVSFQEELKSRLDCDVISDYRNYFFSYEYFYDTNLHLNEEGALHRTNQLIDDLEHWKARVSRAVQKNISMEGFQFRQQGGGVLPDTRQYTA